MKDRLFVGLLFVFFVLGLGIFVLPQNDVSLLEKRNLKQNKDIQVGSLVSSTEAVLKDQFYARESLMQSYYKMKLLLNKPFSSGNLNGIEINYLSDEVIQINDGYMILNLLSYDEGLEGDAKRRGYNVNEMDQMYPDVKTYVYFPTRLEEIVESSDNYGMNYRNGYIAQLNGNIRYDSLKISSVENYQKYYYKSDYHWNHAGAYQGYVDVINMIQHDFDIDSPREINNEIEYPYQFHGNISSKIGKLGDEDVIRDYKLKNEGQFVYYVNDVETDFYAVKNKYSEHGNDTQYSDYDIYFGDNYFKRVFDFNQPDKPNLLILGDSFTNTNMEWIASHFNKTLILDLRARDDNFSFDQYIKEYNVDIVLVQYLYTNMYFNGNLFIPLEY